MKSPTSPFCLFAFLRSDSLALRSFVLLIAWPSFYGNGYMPRSFIDGLESVCEIGKLFRNWGSGRPSMDLVRSSAGKFDLEWRSFE